MTMRVGCGYDIHPLGPGRRLILGGIEVPHSKGLMGHSDSDALVHALCDALLGAMRGKGYRIVNVDTVIIAQAPRLSPHLAAMQKQMAQVLGVDPDLVNVKVKSGEGIGMIGREEGIAAQAVCLIEQASTA